jgi:signal transduction histidine kinase
VLQYSRLSILALVLSCLAAVLTTMRLLRHRDAERQTYVNALHAERDKLEDAVASRTLELSDLARHLQTVREDERSHLARELHDELGGLLTAAKLDLARMRSRLVHAGPEVSERVAHLHTTLDAGIALKRRIIEDLHPSSLENLGLGPALQILCDEWSGGSEIPVEVDLQEITLPPACALVVYRLVQEALTNIAKYAQAHQVSVRLGTAGGQALVQVSDDGRGFPATQRTQGHGLAGMRFRVASIGGQLTVESAPGQGTTIRARLPLQD